MISYAISLKTSIIQQFSNSQSRNIILEGLSEGSQ